MRGKPSVPTWFFKPKSLAKSKSVKSLIHACSISNCKQDEIA